MKSLLVVVVLLLAVAVGLGFYLGWFHFSTGGTDSNPSGTITVDKEKIKEDANTAKEKAQDLGNKAKDKIDDATKKDKEPPHQP